MARPKSYLAPSGDMVKIHPLLPKELTAFVSRTYGTNDEAGVANSLSKSLALALTELKAYKEGQIA